MNCKFGYQKRISGRLLQPRFDYQMHRERLRRVPEGGAEETAGTRNHSADTLAIGQHYSFRLECCIVEASAEECLWRPRIVGQPPARTGRCAYAAFILNRANQR